MLKCSNGDDMPNREKYFSNHNKILHKFLLQVSYYGNATSDLCYLIYSSTTGLFRRKHLQKLLKFYFDTLVESIESFGIQNKVDGRLKFDFDQLLLEFKQVFSGIFRYFLGFLGIFGKFYRSKIKTGSARNGMVERAQEVTQDIFSFCRSRAHFEDD